MSPGPTKTIDLESFLPYRLSVLEQQISRAIFLKYGEKHDLSRMQWRVLSTLAMFDGVTAREICNFTRMEKMQASRAISGLESQGLLSQKTSPLDHRANVLSLTPRGKEVYSQIVPEVLREEQRIFSCLEENELQSLHQLVHKLCAALED